MPIKSTLVNLQPARERLKEEITLLSHGYFNPTAFPDGRCTVYPWDSQIDEWILKHARPTTGFRFYWELAKQLFDLNGCKLEDMPIGDINTIVLVSRAIRHGGQVEYTPTCTECNVANPREAIQIPGSLQRVGEKSADFKGWDAFILPQSRDEIRVRPRLVKDEIMLEARSEDTKKKASDTLVLTLCGIIDIGGGAPDSMDELLSWYHALHPQDTIYLGQQIEKLSPHLSLEVEHQCDVCGQKFFNTLPLGGRDFFRSGRPSVPEGALSSDIRPGMGGPGADSQLAGAA